MLEFNPQKLGALRTALTNFQKRPLSEAGAGLLSSLGYKSEKTADFGSKPEQFIASVEEATHSTFNRDKALVYRWKQCAFLFQLTNDEIPSLAMGQQVFSTDTKLAQNLIESFVFLAIELQGESWSRTDLAAISRELNRRFPMPAIVIFKHGDLISLVVIDRRANLKDAAKDVIDSRITVIKDVRINNPHRAHLDILAGLALENLGEKRRPTNFRELYDAWIVALSIQALNKRFYTELAWWYFWAVKQVAFPQGGGEDESRRNSVAVIRLLTRLIFAWFIKEKELIPEDLFDPARLKTLLKSDPAANGEDSTYYLAILQNLFFASLNVEMGTDRKWAADGGGMKGDRLIHSLYRHKEMFRDPDHALKEYFSKIPFLNGGLFECLDRELTERDFQRNPELKSLVVKEGNGYVLRVDGFSRRKEAQPVVPNKIFFGGETGVDLNADLGTKGKRFDVHGLIDIFGRYKFTVEENTPVEEEVALDPELLGKVFENLLASYNEDTQATARKQSGSFYTPREVVDYMVDEALIAYFERQIISPLPQAGEGQGERVIEARLRNLLSYADTSHEFTEPDVKILISGIESLKILDPACGSGAFPMGVLQKLVHVLKKLDPSNELWKAQNRAPLAAQLVESKKIPDPSLREAKVEDAENALIKFDRDFANAKHADYTRKLYLIEKCIHGVDIQPIAVQIAKLRFFIALVVSQEVDKSKDNWGITALPNLETKIVAADSLTPIREIKAGMIETYQLGHDAIKAIEADLHDASEWYFSARTTKTKRKYRETIQDLHDKLASELEQSGFSTAKAQQLVHWNPFDQNAAADFFDPEWMFQLGEGFDVVIGNPPYVRQEAITESKPKFQALYKSFNGRADLFVYFYERSVKLLKPSGVLSFITSNKWLRAKYGEPLRRFLAGECTPTALLDFGELPVFSAATFPMIYIGRRGAKLNCRFVQVPSLDAPYPDIARVLDTFGQSIPLKSLESGVWSFTDQTESAVIEMMAAAPGRIPSDHIMAGIKTGFNDAFWLDAATKEKIIAGDPRCASYIKPMLVGDDIRHWRTKPLSKWIIYTPIGTDINSLGSIASHLLNWKSRLEHRALNQAWYELQQAQQRYCRLFEEPKIVYPDIAKEPRFTLDDRGRYIDMTAFALRSSDKSLLAILNSSAVWFFLKRTAAVLGDADKGGRLRLKRQYIEKVPIPNRSESNARILATLVDYLLWLNRCFDESQTEKSASDDAMTNFFERVVNALVYELYFPSLTKSNKTQPFELLTKANLPQMESIPSHQRLSELRTLFQRLNANDHPVYAMLFDLQALDVVRIIEGRE